MKETTLGDFLRTRRAALVPEPDDGAGVSRRRVPGLRREEVARLVGVSADYYTKLEQGRRIVPSEGVLSALAHVLELDHLAKEHMYDLVCGNARPRRQQAMAGQQARPGMLRLMESFGGLPAVLVGRRTDVLATSPLARHLITDFNRLPSRERNAARWILLSEHARRIHPDWEAAATGLVGMLRMDAGRYPNDPRTAELIDELSTMSEHFTRIWNDWHIADSVVPESKVLRHALVGCIRFHVEAVTTAADRDQVLQVLIPADSDSRSALRRLQALARAD
ncbi:helix-turn-helix transcriptional regulator [Pseudonocardia xinjiangensis]|uniref:helix-turn-helix transcriptional regulator n=1 Tax=Pseudonocardia xinjiangensis TaxID=75289 RepID=UPI003D927211